MDLCTDSNRDEDRMREICSTGSKDDILWVRKSSGLGINHEYALRQIVDGHGKKIGNKDQGPWKRYLDGVKGTVLLARARKKLLLRSLFQTERISSMRSRVT